MKPLKILLVGNYAPDKQESMQRFAEILNHELKERGHKVRLLRPRTRINRTRAGAGGFDKWLGYIDKFVLFPALLRRAAQRADIVHICDHSNGPYVHTLRHQAHILTCNDVLAIRSALGQVPENPTRWSGKILQRYIVSGLNQVQRVACISHKTKEQLLSVTSISPDKAQVIYMGQNYPYHPMGFSEAQKRVHALITAQGKSIPASQHGFILHIGGNQWYKNRKGVIRIYQSLCQQLDKEETPYLIMAGHHLTEEMNEMIVEAGLQDQVLNLQNVSNEELRALYSCAELLLFPSLAEGFGWPIAEAHACGCRVVTSNDTPMTEVGGEAALYCDPRDEKQAAQTVMAMLREDQSARKARTEAGIANAERFSTQQMIDSYLHLYEKTIDERAGVSEKV